MIETKFGNFELLQNDRDAFDLVKFEQKYLPEYFDKYTYLVGDLSDDILRLKGFSSDPKSKTYFHYIPEYLAESCSYNCKYYILKRIKPGKQDDSALFAKYIGTVKEDKVEEKAQEVKLSVEAIKEEEKKPENKQSKQQNNKKDFVPKEKTNESLNKENGDSKPKKKKNFKRRFHHYGKKKEGNKNE